MKEVVIVSARAERRRQGQEGRRAGERARRRSVGAPDEGGDRPRAGIDPATIDDVFWGCAMPEATQGLNVARLSLAARRTSGRRSGGDDQPILLVGTADRRARARRRS